MLIVKNDVDSKDLGNGVKRKILASDGKLMTVEFSFNKGAIGELHSHPHEQIGYIVKGSFRLLNNKNETIITRGDTYYVPPNAQHGVEALEDGIILDVFTPIRADFLEGA